MFGLVFGFIDPTAFAALLLGGSVVIAALMIKRNPPPQNRALIDLRPRAEQNSGGPTE